MKKSKLVRNIFAFCIFLALVIPSLAQENEISSTAIAPNAEIGDAVFRTFWLFGKNVWHAAIYYCSKSQGADNYNVDDANQNYPVIITASDQKHSVIQASGRDIPLSKQNFNYFLDGKKYWGAYSSGGLDAEKRRKITYYAKFQHGCAYELTSYPKIKKPAKKFQKGGGSFRCDGLVEYCYEWVVDGNGNGIFGEPDDGFFKKEEERKCAPPFLKFYPKALAQRMVLSSGIPPIKAEITYPTNNSNVYGTVEITANVSDGKHGSGIDKVEFYRNQVNRNHLIGIDDHDSDIKGEYRYIWDISSLAIGTQISLLAKVYDRAGNATVSQPVNITIGNKPPIITDVSPINTITNRRPTIRARIHSPDGINIDLNSILMTLDGNAVSHTVTPAPGGPDIRISYRPTVDLSIGQHSVVIDAKDINSIAAEQKSWFFEIIIPPPGTNIVVHCHNPEGKEIASIQGIDQNSVEIYDGNTLIGYGAYNAQTHNKPIVISAGTHTIKAKFNGMTLQQDINLQPNETQSLIFVFSRTERTSTELFTVESQYNSASKTVDISGWMGFWSCGSFDPIYIDNRTRASSEHPWPSILVMEVEGTESITPNSAHFSGMAKTTLPLTGYLFQVRLSVGSWIHHSVAIPATNNFTNWYVQNNPTQQTELVAYLVRFDGWNLDLIPSSASPYSGYYCYTYSANVQYISVGLATCFEQPSLEKEVYFGQFAPTSGTVTDSKSYYIAGENLKFSSVPYDLTGSGI